MKGNKEKIYSRKVLVNGVFEQRSVTESEMSNSDYEYYYNTIREAYNAAPPIVKERFVMDAHEKLVEFLIANGMVTKEDDNFEDDSIEDVKLAVVKRVPMRKPAKKSSGIVN